MSKPFSVTTKANGKTLVRVVVGYNDSGNPVRQSKEFPKDASENEINAWAYSVKAGVKPRVGFVSSSENVIDRWLAAKKLSVSPRTYINYESYSRLYIRGKLKAFTKEAIHEFIFSVRKQNGDLPSPKTVETVRVLLKNILSYAVDEGYLQAAPKVPQVLGNKRLKTIKVLDQTSIYHLSGVLELNGEWALLTMLNTGLRVSELLALERRHLTLDGIRVEQVLSDRWGSKSVSPPKSPSSYRTIPVPHKFFRKLIGYANTLPKSQKFLFDIGQTGLRKRLHKYEKVSLHTLRHTHCSWLLSQGVSVVAVSARLGHHSPQLTLRTYSHLISDKDEGLSKALSKLD